MQHELKGKGTLVRGAASGIGKAIRGGVHRSGASVLLCDINAKALDESRPKRSVICVPRSRSFHRVGSRTFISFPCRSSALESAYARHLLHDTIDSRHVKILCGLDTSVQIDAMESDLQ